MIEPNELAIENARSIVADLATRGVTSARVSDDVDGGAIVTVRRLELGSYIAVACDNEGDAHLIVETPPQLPKVSKVALGDAAAELIAALNR